MKQLPKPARVLWSSPMQAETKSMSGQGSAQQMVAASTTAQLKAALIKTLDPLSKR